MPRSTEDLTGHRFGRLTVLIRDRVRRGHAYWRCACDCGNEASVASSALRSGNTQSCGCLHREMLHERNTGRRPEPFSVKGEPYGSMPRATRRDARRTPAQKATYHSWYGMVRRCTNPDDAAWERYGGRGITVCERWLNYENFVTDVGEKPTGKTLDRINNDGDYEPSNVRWATPRQQARNTRGFKLTPAAIREIISLDASGVGPGAISVHIGISYKTTQMVLSVAEALRETPVTRQSGPVGP